MDDHLIDKLEQDGAVDKIISVQKVVRFAGKSSGLAMRLRYLFSYNTRWHMAWLVVTAVHFVSFFFINYIFGSNYCMSVNSAQLPVSCCHLKLLLTITYVVFNYDYFIILCGV